MSKIKRLTAFVLLFITITFNVAVAEVQAETVQNEAITDVLIAVGAVIGTETALAYALGVLGFTAASVAVYENRDSLIDWCEDVKEDFIEFCAKTDKWMDVTGAKIQNWLEGIGMGVLDKADETWLALKDFCVDIFNKQETNDSITTDPILLNTVNLGDLTEWTTLAYNSGFFKSFEKHTVSSISDFEYSATISHDLRRRDAVWSGSHLIELPDGGTEDESDYLMIADNTEVYFFHFGFEETRASYYATELCTDSLESDFDITNWSCYPFSFLYPHSLWGNYSNFYYFQDSFSRTRSLTQLANGRLPVVSEENVVFQIDSVYSKLKLNTEWFFSFLGYLSHCYYHGIAIPGLDLPLDDGITEEQTAGYVVDGSVGDIIERDGTLDYVDIINPRDVENEKVQVDVDGVGIEDIAKPFPDSRVWTIDAAVDIVLPDGEPVSRPEEGEDSDVDDFTLEGLEKVFPFCVPWDIKSLFETLSADAKAPKFQWEFTYYDSKGKKKEKVEIDLSVFDNVALVFRTMELLAFIVGLLLLTRNSIMSR